MFMRYLIIGIIIGEVILLISAYNMHTKISEIDITNLHETNPTEIVINEVVDLHGD
ncbi:hypothetical protein SAMN05421510_103811 [Nitrosomonas ureae]|uniref:Uncharacterized protein n=1 Tax=Nitrosomonas ureae TaxID=44577 RepID=A0A1H9F553_9PROT|nr:hypothetical protein SAMN05421510_103811 [Nitrosomonas ureae]